MFQRTQGVTIREPLLVLVLGVLAVLAFAAAHTYTKAYDNERAHLGQQWFNRATADLQNNRPDSAIDGFRTALLYAPENSNYRLHLAEALTAANRTDEALGYYQSLWQSNPGNGLVNLQLARLAVRSGQREDAERYFNGAIFGLWDSSAALNRRQALFEMIDFYLRQRDFSSADSQLVVLSENLPDDADLHARVAALFLQVNDNKRAFEQFQDSLVLDPANGKNLAGAANAAFQLRRYDEAKAFIERGVQTKQPLPEAHDLLATIDAILSLNPLAPHIGSVEKAQRIIRVYQIAGDRLNECAAQRKIDLTLGAGTDLGDLSTKWNDLEPSVTERKLRNDADLSQQAVDLTYAIEKQTRNLCGNPPAGPNMALLTLAEPPDGSQ